jgi:hypothetical protein
MNRFLSCFIHNKVCSWLPIESLGHGLCSRDLFSTEFNENGALYDWVYCGRRLESPMWRFLVAYAIPCINPETIKFGSKNSAAIMSAKNMVYNTRTIQYTV